MTQDVPAVTRMWRDLRGLRFEYDDGHSLALRRDDDNYFALHLLSQGVDAFYIRHVHHRYKVLLADPGYTKKKAAQYVAGAITYVRGNILMWETLVPVPQETIKSVRTIFSNVEEFLEILRKDE